MLQLVLMLVFILKLISMCLIVFTSLCCNMFMKKMKSGVFMKIRLVECVVISLFYFPHFMCFFLFIFFVALFTRWGQWLSWLRLRSSNSPNLGLIPACHTIFFSHYFLLFLAFYLDKITCHFLWAC